MLVIVVYIYLLLVLRIAFQGVHRHYRTGTGSTRFSFCYLMGHGILSVAMCSLVGMTRYSGLIYKRDVLVIELICDFILSFTYLHRGVSRGDGVNDRNVMLCLWVL